MSVTLAPLNKTQEVLKALVSCALTLSGKIASGPANLIQSTSHLDTVVEDIAPKRAIVATNKEEELHFSVLLPYHFSAPTGHHNLSSSTAEIEEILARKIYTTGEDTP